MNVAEIMVETVVCNCCDEYQPLILTALIEWGERTFSRF